MHSSEIALQSLTERLALPAHLVLPALAAPLLEPKVERPLSRELRNRDHEVTAAIANQPFHIAFLVPFTRTRIAVADHVCERNALNSVARCLVTSSRIFHQAAVVVADNWARQRAEEREGMNVSVHPEFVADRRNSGRAGYISVSCNHADALLR